MSAKTLFEKLQQENIIGSGGSIYCELLDIKTPIKDNSVVGKVLDTHSSADSLRKGWLDSVKNTYKQQTGLEL